MAMVAARAGTSALIYSLTRTPGELVLDLQAWLASWAVPLAMIFPGEASTVKKRAAAAREKGRWEWLNRLPRPLRRQVHFFELPDLDATHPTDAARARAASGLATGSRLVSPRAARSATRRPPWEEGARPPGWTPSPKWAGPPGPA